MGNPRLPPFPHPTTIQPLAQIKSQDIIAGLGAGISGATALRPKSPPHSASSADSVFSVAATFASPRLWVTSSTLNVERSMYYTRFPGSFLVILTHSALPP